MGSHQPTVILVVSKIIQNNFHYITSLFFSELTTAQVVDPFPLYRDFPASTFENKDYTSLSKHELFACGQHATHDEIFLLTFLWPKTMLSFLTISFNLQQLDMLKTNLSLTLLIIWRLDSCNF
jgi:hypothetical protein